MKLTVIFSLALCILSVQSETTETTTPSSYFGKDLFELLTSVGRVLRDLHEKLDQLKPKKDPATGEFLGLPKKPMSGRLFKDVPNMVALYSYHPLKELVFNVRHASGYVFGIRLTFAKDGKDIRASFVAQDPAGYRVVSGDLNSESPVPMPICSDGKDNLIDIAGIISKLPSIF